jgi:hypothetical protein
MNVSSDKLFAATVAYADVFDYPLTPDELKLWSIISDTSKSIQKTYITLPGRNNIIRMRKNRRFFSEKKWHIAYHAARLFRYIPTIMLVGITGGLAMNNANKNDDIDMFFITRPKTIWISRLLAILISNFFGLRRKRGEAFVSDKICLNMFMTSEALRLATRDQDLFSAHEVLQMVPLWERNSMYTCFLRENSWVHFFLPNAFSEKLQSDVNTIPFRLFWSVCVQLFEAPARLVQFWHMRTHITTEVVSDTLLRFHPRDARVWVKQKFAKRLKKYNIPIDKIFYHR